MVLSEYLNPFLVYFSSITCNGFLKLKGYSQYAKTILSPITQVRNVLSASLFAVAQGNVGRGANVNGPRLIVANDMQWALLSCTTNVSLVNVQCSEHFISELLLVGCLNFRATLVRLLGERHVGSTGDGNDRDLMQLLHGSCK